MDTKVAKWQSIEVFCCYAREDQSLLLELKNHLMPLQREGLITLWADVDIKAGIAWENELHRHLNTAQIILLLISSDFMSSDYCYSVEMRRAMERYERGEARVIPIILRPVHWKGTPFGKLQALPTDGAAVTEWQNQDSAFFDVAEGIRKAIEKDIRKAIDELTAQVSSLNQVLDDVQKIDFSVAEGSRKAIAEDIRKAIDELTAQVSSLKQVLDDVQKIDFPSTKPDILTTPIPVRSKAVLQWTRGKMNKVPVVWRVLLLVMVLLCVISTVGGILYFHFRPTSTLTTTNHPTSTLTTTIRPTSTPTTTICGLCVQLEPDGETTGISDGGFAFDTGLDRSSGPDMQQAATDFTAGKINDAKRVWTQAAEANTNNAEAWIYLEDQRVIDSGTPYIDIVVATMLTGDHAAITVGRDDLQGAYVAQMFYNSGRQLPNGIQVRLLIANSGCQDSGCDKDFAIPVAQQIAQLANTDTHFVGVMGWPYSAPALEALQTLQNARIPIVSQTASSEELPGTSPYLFRVAPPNLIQGQTDARYAETALHATRVALFIGNNNSYSRTLAQAFRDQFTKDGYSIVATELYTVGNPNNFPGLLADAESHSPNLIYFSGYAADASVLLIDLPTNGPFADLQVMGSDGLNEQGAYQPSSFAAGWRLHFTTDAHPDEWGAYCNTESLQQAPGCPSFFSNYRAAFNPNGTHLPNIYGYTRPSSDAIMSYDATLTLLTAAQRMLTGSKTSLTPADLLLGLQHIQGAQAVQGVSGQISFDKQGNPTNKAMVIAKVVDGHIQIDSMTGCFKVGAC